MCANIGLIIDLDGTMYRGKQMVEHADVFTARLREAGVPHLFLTNNSSRTPADVAEHLADMGIHAGENDVYTAAQAAARYIGRAQKDAKVYVIGEHGLRQAVSEAGLAITDERPDYVVQGIDRSFDYEKLARAVRHIRAGAGYILTNPDLLLPADDELIPGAGSISAAIQAAAGQQPVVIGKPSPIIMEDAIRLLGLPADRIWVVGDNLSTDIGAGKAAGCRTALVLTGITTRNNLQAMLDKSGVQPDLICADLPQLLEELVPR